MIRNDYCYKARDLLRRILIPHIVTISSDIPNEIMDRIELRFLLAYYHNHYS